MPNSYGRSNRGRSFWVQKHQSKNDIAKGQEERIIDLQKQLHEHDKENVDLKQQIKDRDLKIKELEKLAMTDELTGTGNLRCFKEKLAEAIANARTSGHSLALICLDIDYLKTVNDRYGHHVGDDLLTMFADTVREAIRGTDIFCRVGGDEFALILPKTSHEIALKIGERILESVSNIHIETLLGGDIGVSVSLGIAMLTESDTLETFRGAADGELYTAKASGRNCLVGNLKKDREKAYL